MKNARRGNAPTEDSLQSIENIDSLTISRLGAVRADRRNSFPNFSEKKKAGTIRIGCFGDSFTYGSEAGDGYDYPSLLAKIFEANGYTDIEVINFGMPGYGFHQAFIMWKYVASKYDLDYVLLGPQCFQVERDTTFRFPHALNFSFFHARYIISYGKLKLIDPLGDTLSERFHYWFRFVPLWRYLRFDLQAPAFLASWLPAGKAMNNPFYYRRDFNKETHEIYGLMLSEMAGSDEQIILGHASTNLVALAQQLDLENLFAFSVHVPERFPYLALRRHYSPNGYYLTAQQMFTVLTGDIDKCDIGMMTTREIQNRVPSTLSIEKMPLHQYDRALIQMNDNDVGCFLNAEILGPGTFFGLAASPDQTIESGRTLHNQKISSLLALKHIHKSIMDSIFLPLDIELNDTMPFVMRVETENGVENHLLGTVKLVNPHLNIGFVDWHSGGDLSLRIGAVLAENSLNTDYLRAGGYIPARSTAAFFLGNNLISTGHNPLIIRSVSNGNLCAKELGREGTIYLKLWTGENEAASVPFAEWEFQPQPIRPETKGSRGMSRYIERVPKSQ